MHPDYLSSPAEGWRRGLDVRQLREWQTYYEATPWGEDRADLREGLAAMATINRLRWGGPAVKLKDFALFGAEVSAEQKLKLAKARAAAFAIGTGGKVTRK